MLVGAASPANLIGLADYKGFIPLHKHHFFIVQNKF